MKRKGFLCKSASCIKWLKLAYTEIEEREGQAWLN
jgi:hypothetical protein